MSYSSEDMLDEMNADIVEKLNRMVKQQASGKRILAAVYAHVQLMAQSCAVCPKCGKPK